MDNRQNKLREKLQAFKIRRMHNSQKKRFLDNEMRKCGVDPEKLKKIIVESSKNENERERTS